MACKIAARYNSGRPALVHIVDGFKVRFTHRTSWKAEIRANGNLIAIAPVVWTEDRRQSGREAFQAVRFQDLSEMEQTRLRREPFIVALAMAENYNIRPRKVRTFQGIFEVVSTGIQIKPDRIDTRVIRRRHADEFDH
jgi:hypothetical protein